MTFDADSLRFPSLSDSAAERRAALLQESFLETAERWALGAAWALKPSRAAGLPALARLWLRDLVAPCSKLPDPERALSRPEGFCSFVHDLSVPTLVEFAASAIGRKMECRRS